MICQFRNLIYYLHVCYSILYAKGMGSGIQAIDKTDELLSVMAVCRNAFHNGAMTYTWLQFHESSVHRILVACVVLMEAILPCFKGALSDLRQLLIIENPLKMMKKFFLFQLKSSFRSSDI